MRVIDGSTHEIAHALTGPTTNSNTNAPSFSSCRIPHVGLFSRHVHLSDKELAHSSPDRGRHPLSGQVGESPDALKQRLKYLGQKQIKQVSKQAS
jgi:hypothetical protein